ncbi:MAG TPA: DNA polymerase I [Moorella mulderi]|nr:DNA polymerase I [Moorella mulderi]
MAREKLLLIDANSIIHRAFHALPPLQTSTGIQTNAVFGFANMLQKALATVDPQYVVVAFDHSKVSFRTGLYQDYKGTRPETAPELRPQFALVKELVAAWGFPLYEKEGYEADDIIGTLAKKGKEAGPEVLILTGDRDALQLVEEGVKVLLMRRGTTETETYDLRAVEERYGIKPHQLIDVKALMGDPSDNIPGVPGIGEKTALQLIRQYGSVEEVLAHLEEIKNKKIRENLKAYRDQVLLAKKLATIQRDVPVELEWEKARRCSPDYGAILKLYKQLEFNSLIKEILKEMGEKHQPPPQLTKTRIEIPPVTKLGLQELETLVEELKGTEVVLSFAWETPNYLEAPPLGVGLSWEKGAGAWLGSRGEGRILAEKLQPLLTAEPLYHDAKAAMVSLRQAGAQVGDPGGDTMIAGYLLNPTASSYDLPQLCLTHLDWALVEEGDLHRDLGQKASAIRFLHQNLLTKLQLAGMERLYREVELPLTRVLGEMEIYGVTVDLETLEAIGKELESQIETLSEEIYQLAGERFNINSPRQLAVVLFEKLGLPPLKKTKTGFSTDSEVLEELAEKHPIAVKLLEYRQLAKLKSTYVEGIKALVNPSTRTLHTTFNQTVTATGRLSSSEPNLQNIPIRLEVGRQLRKIFIPRSPDRVLLSGDYSQIELRILAHLSQDEGLIRSFMEGEDIHTRTAAEVFGVPLEEVTPLLRRRAKAVNFGIIYGISDFGLSRELGISRSEAHEYVERYFQRYPKVKEYLDRVVNQARLDGYVTTILGRRRYIPELFSPNYNVRSFGERVAMNTPIQGSAADIIKVAMVKLFKRLEKEFPEAKLILQVHDELILDVPQKILLPVAEVVKGEMEGAVKLRVPLKVELKWGPNWYDMQPLEEI